MTNLEKLTRRELEIAQVKRAIVRHAAHIIRLEAELSLLRKKQTGRHCEVAIQETLARCSNKSILAAVATTSTRGSIS